MAREFRDDVVESVEPPLLAENFGHDFFEQFKIVFAEGYLRPEFSFNLSDPLARDPQLVPDRVEGHAVGMELNDVEKPVVPHSNRTNRMVFPKFLRSLGPQFFVERVGRREVEIELEVQVVVIQPGQICHA